MDLPSVPSEQLFAHAADQWRQLCAANKGLLDVIRELDRRDAWETEGAHDMAHWVSIAFGLSHWRAARWVEAAEALTLLPRVAQALEAGELSIYKVEELVRFADPDDDEALVWWAEEVPSGAIRAEADRRRRADAQEVAEIEDRRELRWWQIDEGRGFGLQAVLPAADGQRVVDAIDRIAAELPKQTGGSHPVQAAASKTQLRADALVALAAGDAASSGGAVIGGTTAARPTILVHAPLDVLIDGEAAAQAGWTDDAAVIAPEVLQRLLCDATVKTIVEDATGSVLGGDRTTRFPSRAVVRRLRQRDRGCMFPNCAHGRFTQAHHIRWWSQGGSTDLDNLVLVCTFHHKLVHEHGWSLTRDGADGVVRWFRPDGTGYRAGPRDPADVVLEAS